MAEKFGDRGLPPVKPMSPPPDSRIIPIDRQDALTHAQVEQVRFGLGDTGPLAQAVMNSNIAATTKQIFGSGVSCTSDRRPRDPVQGQMIYETDTKLMKFWDGTAWVTGTGSGAILTPVGSIVPYAGTDLSTPAGWLFCAGQTVSQTTYADLFLVIGTAYNTGGEAAGDFRIPDLRGRVAAGKDNMLGIAASRLTAGTSGITGTTLGAAGGNQALHSHTHTQDSHNHTQNAHQHTMSNATGAGANSGFTGNVMAAGGSYWVPRSTANVNDFQNNSGTNSLTATNIATTATNQNTGAGASQNVQPTLVTNYIIKATADTVTGYAGTTLTGAAGGDLTGTYPNPALTTISNVPVYNSNSTISLRTSNVERMGIDASGRMTRPFQPYFKAHSPGGISVVNGGKWPLTIVTTNVGSNFNTGTYLFTAPVAGVYVFGGMWRVQANLSYIHTQPYVNGVASSDNGELPGLTGFGTSVSGFTATSFYYTRYLNANDNIYFGLNNNAGGTYTVYQQSYLTGFLMS